MSNTPPKDQNKKLYWSVLAVVAALSLLAIILFRSVDQSSINSSYGTVFEGRSSRTSESSSFNQRGTGFSESEIHKYKGHRYETY